MLQTQQKNGQNKLTAVSERNLPMQDLPMQKEKNTRPLPGSAAVALSAAVLFALLSALLLVGYLRAENERDAALRSEENRIVGYACALSESLERIASAQSASDPAALLSAASGAQSSADFSGLPSASRRELSAFLRICRGYGEKMLAEKQSGRSPSPYEISCGELIGSYASAASEKIRRAADGGRTAIAATVIGGIFPGGTGFFAGHDPKAPEQTEQMGQTGQEKSADGGSAETDRRAALYGKYTALRSFAESDGKSAKKLLKKLFPSFDPSGSSGVFSFGLYDDSGTEGPEDREPLPAVFRYETRNSLAEISRLGCRLFRFARARPIAPRPDPSGSTDTQERMSAAIDRFLESAGIGKNGGYTVTESDTLGGAVYFTVSFPGEDRGDVCIACGEDSGSVVFFDASGYYIK